MAAAEGYSPDWPRESLGHHFCNDPVGTPRQTYRPSIDGLRAWAVWAVVLYHVGVPGITGGFIGVDVFFVISGFLITSQLVSARHAGFGAVLLEFYGRRVRRILPSLTIVTLVTLALGWLFLLPDGEQQDLAKSAVASAFFVSNIFFWHAGKNYFAGPMELQPLLHMWTLSVEEQFYLLWPLLLLLIASTERWWRMGSLRLLTVAVFVLSALSFAVSVRWLVSDPQAAFYLTPSRVWELGTGALLALLLQNGNEREFPAALAFAGLAAIVASALLYDRRTSFPGAAALLPVAGAVMVIVANVRQGRGILSRLLTVKPVLTTGKISYSWYLWHWPLLAIARAHDLGRHNLLRDSLIAGLAYGVAFLSTRYVETPIRERRFALFRNATRSILAGAGAIAICCAVPLALWAFARVEYRKTYALLRPETVACTEPYLNHKLTPVAPCILAKGGRGTVFLIGDSFADHWSPAIGAWARGADVSAVERTLSSCNIIVAQPDGRDGRSGCEAFSTQVLGEIRRAAGGGSLVGVVVSDAWPSSEDLARALAPPLSAAVGALEGIGVRVLLIGPSPIFPFSVPKCLVRRPEASCRLARGRFDADSKGIWWTLKRVSSGNVRVWNPSSQFCDGAWCYPSRNGVPSFSDDGHISRPAALRAEGDLAPDLNWLMGNSTLLAPVMPQPGRNPLGFHTTPKPNGSR